MINEPYGMGGFVLLPPGGDPDWTGTVTLRYTVTNPLGASTQGSVTINLVEEQYAARNGRHFDLGDDEFGWLGDGGYLGNVLLNDRIFSVQAGGNVTGTNSAGDTYLVTAAHNLGDVTSGGHIGRVVAGGNLAAVTAPKSIGHVEAGGDITGSVQAQGGDIGKMRLGSAAASYAGYGESFYSTFSQDGPGVVAGGNFKGAVSATGDITYVFALGDIDGAITAGGRLDEVYAVGNISGAIGSQAGPLLVTSLLGGVSSTITASGTIDLFAFGDVTGTVTSRDGDVWLSATNLAGSVAAEEGFAFLDVYGNLTGSVQGAWGVVAAVGKAVTGAVISRAGGILLNAGGPISGMVSANDEFGWIEVNSIKDISGNLCAEHGPVFARSLLGDISSTITAGDTIGLFTLGNATGSFTSQHGDIFVDATDVRGSISAENGVAVLNVFGDLSATVSAFHGVFAIVRGAVGESVKSSAGLIRIIAAGEVSASLTAAGDQRAIEVISLGNITGALTAEHGSIHATSVLGNITAKLDAGRDAIAFALTGDISSEIRAGRDAYVYSDANVTHGPVLAGRNVFITAAGDITAEITSTQLRVVSANASVEQRHAALTALPADYASMLTSLLLLIDSPVGCSSSCLSDEESSTMDSGDDQAVAPVVFLADDDAPQDGTLENNYHGIGTWRFVDFDAMFQFFGTIARADGWPWPLAARNQRQIERGCVGLAMFRLGYSTAKQDGGLDFPWEVPGAVFFDDPIAAARHLGTLRIKADGQQYRLIAIQLPGTVTPLRQEREGRINEHHLFFGEIFAGRDRDAEKQANVTYNFATWQELEDGDGYWEYMLHDFLWDRLRAWPLEMERPTVVHSTKLPAGATNTVTYTTFYGVVPVRARN